MTTHQQIMLQAAAIIERIEQAERQLKSVVGDPEVQEVAKNILVEAYRDTDAPGNPGKRRSRTPPSAIYMQTFKNKSNVQHAADLTKPRRSAQGPRLASCRRD
jgi:hypothetical protein